MRRRHHQGRAPLRQPAHAAAHSEAQTRALAYMLKDPDCDQDMIDAAAREMARLIEGERGYLVPVPSHTRSTTANRRLANALCHMTGNKFDTADILSRKEPTESACERHRNSSRCSRQRPTRFFFASASHPHRIDNSTSWTTSSPRQHHGPAAAR